MKIGYPPRVAEPRPYLDTMIIIDYIRRRGRTNDSMILLETIKRRKIQCFTSYFTVLELTDRQQEEKYAIRRMQEREDVEDIVRNRYPRRLRKEELSAVRDELNEKFFQPFVETNIINVMTPEVSAWANVFEALKVWNFSIADAFHVDAAMGNNCNIFITNDSELINILNKDDLIPASRPIPNELEDMLKKHGIKPILLF